MLRNARNLEDFELRARDGRIGRVVDFFFDDRCWTIRYFVVDTGTWLDHREVLIAPTAVHVPDVNERVLPVDLSRAQVEQSPLLNPDEPVSRETELMLMQHYDWPAYWLGTGFGDTLFVPSAPFLTANAPHRSRAATASSLDEQHHIRRVDDVRGHRLEATDGDIGHVDDFLIEDRDWTMAYLIVDTRNWWPGKRVLVSPDSIFEVGWDEARVFVDLPRDEIKRRPAYEPGRPVATASADSLCEHYGQPHRNAEP